MSKKMTRVQREAHARACDLIHGDKDLTVEDLISVYANWHPAVDHNVSVNGAFFTPVPTARDLAVWTSAAGHDGIIDLCAGIGGLSFALLRCGFANITAVEINPDLVAIGKRLLPRVNWVCADVFDQAAIGRLNKEYGPFKTAVSNPPYGKVAMDKDMLAWLKYSKTAELAVVEVAMRLCSGCKAVFLLPQSAWPADAIEYVKNAEYGSMPGQQGMFQAQRPHRAFVKVWPDVYMEYVPGPKIEFVGTNITAGIIEIDWGDCEDLNTLTKNHST